MKNTRDKAHEIRTLYPRLQQVDTPIDIVRFIELDLKLNIVPLPKLATKYRISAALSSDRTAILVDEEEYRFYDDRGEDDWITRRFRFSLAHEAGHYFLHDGLMPASALEDRAGYDAWLKDYGGDIYDIEKQANEFAGAILVPKDRLVALKGHVVAMKKHAVTGSHLGLTPAFRDVACDLGAEMFAVNRQVIDVRFNREGVWLSEN